MQSLYAYKGTEGDDFKKDETFLKHSLDSMYDLHLSILALLTEIHKKAEDYSTKLKKRHLNTDTHPNLNTKLKDNQILRFIRENSMVQDVIAKRKLNFWDLDFEYVDILFKDIINSELYKTYTEDSDDSLKSDKAFILSAYSEIIAPNDKLYNYFEDKKLTWVDDLPVVNTMLLKLIRKIKLTASESILLPDLYKDEDDKTFAEDLFKKTLLNTSKFSEEIALKTKNWDSERLASIDGVLLKMALCEFQKFSSIPYKVTINEYLEIAKEYSTPKSSLFINGILDKIVKEYQAEKLHLKTGRGLM
ncbi:transcription antitermination factor NusB [uncultured Winogradskyella sp.]|uniref:transcription antitermination factor NusB n=1 Tax=uncultured Winogradskyella sp. TaxID=395353 RepID=UPI0026261A4B|nr:transcription antitermination factor NusB [uncultured Winogradskyella sp.]